MRTINGWTKDEQDELKWHGINGNSLDDVIDTLYDQARSNYLYDKYNKSDDPEQVMFDIVDYWRGEAKFPEKKYIVKLPDNNVLIYNEYTGFRWKFDIDKNLRVTQTGDTFNLSMDKIKTYYENLVPFAVEVEDE